MVVYTFLRAKPYSKENTRHYPTETYVTFTQNIQALFVKLFDAVKCMTGIQARLHEKLLLLRDNFSSCDEPAFRIKPHARI